MSQEKFNVIEYAINSALNRHHFALLSEEQPSTYWNDNFYRSHFNHSQEIIDYYNNHTNEDGKKTLSGYDNVIWADEFTIDIDDSDLQNALERTKNLIKHLESEYEINLFTIKINFSGSKGFHIKIPASLFGGFEATKDLNLLIKSLAMELTEGVTKIDESIYKQTGLIRMVNSKNKKSGLYAIPLTINEVLTLTMDKIKEMAVTRRNEKFDFPDNILTVPKLETLKNLLIKKINKSNVNKAPINEIYSQKSTGERHDSLLQIIGKLIAAKINEDHIYEIAKLWNKQNLPAKPDKEFYREVHGMIHDFGNKNGKYWVIRRNQKGPEAEIDPDDFMQWLEEEGFCKYYFGKAYDFVRIKNNIAEPTMPAKIKDFVMNDIYNSGLNTDFQKVLRSELRMNIGRLFNEKLLETIATTEIELKKDTKDTSSLFYKNCIVEVKKDSSLKQYDYPELDKPIWDTQILDREFEEIKAKYKVSEFETFLRNAVKSNEDRFLSLCSAIGFLLHKFKNKSVAKAIIFLDEKITENPVGRTGKSFMGKALSYMRNEVRIDGKNFEFNPKFTFQEVTPQTELIDFNDIKKDFDFEKLFSVLTDNMKVEYKNQPPFPLPFEESPKILISTNYTINGEGDSYKDRMFEIEFSDHYNAQHKPIDEFGHLLFDDWSEEEWNRFDNFMIECLQLYLDEGLIEYKRINIAAKKLLLETSSEFTSFMDGEFEFDFEYDKDVLFQKFKNYIGFGSDMFDKCPIKKNMFTKWLKKYAGFNSLDIRMRDSNGIQYVTIKSE
jgi:transcriptional regulator of heat shock response